MSVSFSKYFREPIPLPLVPALERIAGWDEGRALIKEAFKHNMKQPLELQLAVVAPVHTAKTYSRKAIEDVEVVYLDDIKEQVSVAGLQSFETRRGHTVCYVKDLNKVGIWVERAKLHDELYSTSLQDRTILIWAGSLKSSAPDIEMSRQIMVILRAVKHLTFSPTLAALEFQDRGDRRSYVRNHVRAYYFVTCSVNDFAAKLFCAKGLKLEWTPGFSYRESLESLYLRLEAYGYVSFWMRDNPPAHPFIKALCPPSRRIEEQRSLSEWLSELQDSFPLKLNSVEESARKSLQAFAAAYFRYQYATSLEMKKREACILAECLNRAVDDVNTQADIERITGVPFQTSLEKFSPREQEGHADVAHVLGVSEAEVQALFR